jgi:tRNA(Ile)-lysidine synthase
LKAFHQPVTDVEADGAFQRLERFQHVILAVSGGPDSMALLVLAAEWGRRQVSAPALSVATVDHGLRAASAGEAEFVAEAARRLGLSHTILRWEGEKPGSGLAEAARLARYRLLERFARSLGDRTAVVTAHHLDDQAETFAMRLARGAGIEGLAAMRPERTLVDGSTVTLVRPLLAFPKSRLHATLEERDLGFVEDPTNDDMRFERVRVRRNIAALDSIGISASALATSARRIGEAEAALRYAEARFTETLRLSFGHEVFAALDREAFSAGPLFLRQKVLARLITRYGGATPAPRLSEVEELTARLQDARNCTATLGGAVVSAGGRFIRVWREPGRLAQPDLELSPGEVRLWDRRFLVATTLQCSYKVTVSPLGPENYSKISNHLTSRHRLPARAAYALPAFWAGSDLVAVPSLEPFATAPFGTAADVVSVVAISASH